MDDLAPDQPEQPDEQLPPEEQQPPVQEPQETPHDDLPEILKHLGDVLERLDETLGKEQAKPDGESRYPEVHWDASREEPPLQSTPDGPTRHPEAHWQPPAEPPLSCKRREAALA